MALVIGLFFMLIGWIVSARLKSKFKKYSETHLSKDLTGAEVARLMLADNGIRDVQVISVEGQLTDHYDPSSKTVNLSHDVFYGRKCCLHGCRIARMRGMPCSTLRLIPCCNYAPQWCQFKT